MSDSDQQSQDISATLLAKAIVASTCPFSLGLPDGLDAAQAKAVLADAGTDEAWSAYDLVHQLQVFGRAF